MNTNSQPRRPQQTTDFQQQNTDKQSMEKHEDHTEKNKKTTKKKRVIKNQGNMTQNETLTIKNPNTWRIQTQNNITRTDKTTFNSRIQRTNRTRYFNKHELTNTPFFNLQKYHHPQAFLTSLTDS